MPKVLERTVSAAALAVAAVALGYALQVNLGTYHPEAMKYLTLALAFAALGVAAPRVPLVERWGDQAPLFFLALGFALQLALLLTTPPGIFLRIGSAQTLRPFYFCLVASGVLVGAGFSASPWLLRVRPAAVGAVFLVLGAWLLRASPDPHIDVFVFQRDGAAELLDGRNPFSMTFPDILHDPLIYGPGLQQNGRLMFGFPYPPVALLLAVPGHLLAGDFRYAQLLAMVGAAALLAYAVPGRLAAGAAALFLFTPRSLFVLEQGWSDPLVFLCFAAVVFCAGRSPKYLPYALGVFLVSKQYNLLALPAVFLLLPRPLAWRESGRFLLKTAATGAALTLPFFLWDPKGFWHSVVALQFLQPFRGDALSYLGWHWHQTKEQLPSLVGFLAVVPASALALWRCPRTPAGFAAAVAFIYLVFFAFNKQAFCNYYYFVVGALCAAVAASRLDSPGRSAPAAA
ncbi:MAG: hypothetical protein ACOZIN_02230 [Myxococcota bacterium]